MESRPLIGPSIWVGVWIKVGARHESPSALGISHLLEHSVFDETRAHPRNKIISRVERLGGEIGAATSKEYTLYYANVPRDSAKPIVRLMLDAIFRPDLTREALTKEKRIITDEIRSMPDSPDEYSWHILGQESWRGQALGHPPSGTVRTVLQVSLRDLLSYWRSNYVPNRVIVTLTGSRIPHEIDEFVEAKLGSLRGRNGPIRTTPPRFRAGMKMIRAPWQHPLIIASFEIKSAVRWLF